MSDPSLKTSRFFIDLLCAIRHGCINYDLVEAGKTGNNLVITCVLCAKHMLCLDEECIANAKYAISVARKIGCNIFLSWEDIIDLNAKLILLLLASIMTEAVSKR